MRIFRRAFEIALIAAIAGWFCFYRLESYSFGVGDFDQTLHAKVVQEMVHNGTHLTPTLDGHAYSNKPPFKMWLTAAVVSTFGESTFTYRVVDGIVGTLFLVVFFIYARSLISSSLGAWCAFAALLACPLLFQAHGLRDGTQDGMLNLLMLATLICADFGSQSIVAGNRRHAVVLSALSGFFLGLALLTKSAGAFVVVPVIAASLLLRGSLWHVLRKGWSILLIGGVFSCILPAVYLIVRFAQPRHGSWRLMWHNEVMNRAFTGFQNRERPLFYYHLIFGDAAAVPPLILTVALLWGAYLLFRYKRKEMALPLAWAVVPVLCYSLMKSRLPWYISFAFPGMALVVGYTTLAAYRLACRLPGAVQTKNLRTLSQSIASVVFLSLGSWQLFGSIQQTAHAIAKPTPILEVERVVKLLKPGLNYHDGKGKVYSIIPKARSIREERIYWDMLGRRPLRAKDLHQTLQKPDLRVMIVELEQLPKIAHLRRPIGFTLVLPYKRRITWLAVMYFNEQDIAKLPQADVVLSDTSFDCAEDTRDEFGTFWEQSAQGDKGCFIKTPTGSHPLPLRGGTGATLTYHLSLTNESIPVTLRAKVGHHSVGSAVLKGPGIQTVTFTVPPGIVTRSSRSIEIELQNANSDSNDQTPAPVTIHRLQRSLTF